VLTVRRGTASEEEGSIQSAAFAEGQYFNAGPMRISHHHATTLAYCRELGVATEVFVPDCESAYLAQTRGPLAGRRVRLREARADFDGHIAELLSKALSQSQLDQPLTAQDRERVLTYLRNLGALDERDQYRGSSRRGESVPLPLRDLFTGIPDFYVQTDWSSQPTMMQVAGGMDRLPSALAARLGGRVTYRARVREIRQGERGVWVVYDDGNGRPRRVDADYCVTTIPLPVLNDIQKDLSPAVQSAIAASRYDGAGKIGMQFKRRFWEQDDEIYGGRSWTDQEVGQIIYPSHGFGGSNGVLVGYYLDFRGTMRKRAPEEIQRLALEHGTRVHPQYPAEFENAFSVTCAESSEATKALAPLRQADGRVHFAGDYMTDMSSWMQGAFESAREVSTSLHRRVVTR
jgi:monoamine oxidase